MTKGTRRKRWVLKVLEVLNKTPWGPTFQNGWAELKGTQLVYIRNFM